MEYDEREIRPESNRKFLIQQVHEQSNLCDVTVKMGLWEKKFHRCVLVISPFFDHIINDNFQEKQTGKIEIAIGTPMTLETAVMFLYGKKPQFNQDNIEHILHMAEFLLIPNLKSAGIAWLKSVTITEDNCMRFLQLSSILDFEIPGCIDYIEEHLSEMLLNPQMVNLTKDSIHMLFSDERLSYVAMDDKLAFLLRWIDAIPSTRTIHIQKLFTTIDFREVSPNCLHEHSQSPHLADFLKEKQQSCVPSCSHRRVLITKLRNSVGTFWCLDLDSKQWFRVDSESFIEETSYHYQDIIGTCLTNSESAIFLVEIGYEQTSILILNLSRDMCSRRNVTVSNEPKEITKLIINEDRCVVLVDELMKKERKKDGRILLSDYIHTSTLYTGHIGDGDVNMSPLLSFKDDIIIDFVAGQNAIAIILESREIVIIYDLVERNFETIEKTTDYDDKLTQLKNGFVIYNNTRCIYLTRMSVPSLSNKYAVVDKIFETHDFTDISFFLCGETLYRNFRKSYRENYNFECTSFETLIFQEQDESVAWKTLPLPKAAEQRHINTITDACFEISLPKHLLRCHVDCPHCKRKTRSGNSRYSPEYVNDDCDYYYEDAPSDDGFYVTPYLDDYLGYYD